MGPHLAEQVVLVIETGSSKSLIFIIGALVIDAQTIILVLLIVIL
jgi:superfamily II DNA helicase RecQ